MIVIFVSKENYIIILGFTVFLSSAARGCGIGKLSTFNLSLLKISVEIEIYLMV